MPPNSDVIEAPPRHVHKPLPHDSGAKHVQGSAEYIDDIPEPIGTLHIAVGVTPVARGTLRRLDLTEVRSAPGVVAVLTAADIPGKNDVSPGSADEPVLVQDVILYHHQPVFAVAATSRDAARRAVLRAKMEIDAEAPNVSVEQGRTAGEIVMPDYAFVNGDAATAIAAAPLRASGQFHVGGQEHFYLEGQIALAVPGEDGSVLVHSSTQHPSEVQHVTARVLGVPDSFVTCRVRRMGGGFGGKETQATQWAALAALAARITGRACKFRLDRDADMAMTGKRHDFAVAYSVGFDADGRIRALDLDLDARCGCSADCSIGVVDRAMFHSDNAYFLPEFAHLYAPGQNQHGVEHRLPRLRRAAGNDGDRARHRCHRLESRPGSARHPQGQFVRPGPRSHAVWPDRRGLRHRTGADRAARALVRAIASGARRLPRSMRARLFSSAVSR